MAIVFDKPRVIDKYGLGGFGQGFGKGLMDAINTAYKQKQDDSALQAVLEDPEVKDAIESEDPNQSIGVLTRIVADPNMSKEARARALTFFQNAIILKRKKKAPERPQTAAVSNGTGEGKNLIQEVAERFPATRAENRHLPRKWPRVKIPSRKLRIIPNRRMPVRG